MICSNCQAENPDGAHFCNRCGTRFGDAYFDADLEQRLLDRIEAKLKDSWLSKEVVEKEIALNAASRLSEWTKLFAIAVAVPAAILTVVLAFYDIHTASDVKNRAEALESQFKPLQDELPKLTQVATTLRGLEDRVQHVESQVAEFAPSTMLSPSTQTQLNSILNQYSQFLSNLGLRPKFMPTVHVQNKLEPGYHSYLRGTDIYVLPAYARPANVLREFSHAVLMEPIGSPDEQWQYSAIEAGVASYLTADFLKAPTVDVVNLDQRIPISQIPHTFQGGQNEGALAYIHEDDFCWWRFRRWCYEISSSLRFRE
jgi:hypothetical protein